MKVIDHLRQADRPLISFEIIPPARGKSVADIIRMVEQIEPAKPPFIDVTSHMAEATYDELPDGSIKRRVKKKRPGTISICGIIQNRYKIDTVPHLLATGCPAGMMSIAEVPSPRPLQLLPCALPSNSWQRPLTHENRAQTDSPQTHS